MIAPACSAAFPTIGNKIILMKLTDIPQDSDAAYIMMIVIVSNNIIN